MRPDSLGSVNAAGGRVGGVCLRIEDFATSVKKVVRDVCFEPHDVATVQGRACVANTANGMRDVVDQLYGQELGGRVSGYCFKERAGWLRV